MKTYALFSVYDKTDVDVLAMAFVKAGFSLVATGNTLNLLKDKGLEVLDISELTGEPERFGGRVKTLHHKVQGGILFRPGIDDSEWPFDFRIGAVVCNFYPFEEKAKECSDLISLMDWVDIGGPTMVRASAKSYQWVWSVTSPEQYPAIIETLVMGEEEQLQLRTDLSREAFGNVSDYDDAIDMELSMRADEYKKQELRYGENPHQKAEFTSTNMVKTFGDVSYNNIRDAEGAFRFVITYAPVEQPAVSVVKHQTLCGAAASKTPGNESEVFNWAWEGDTVSRFGGVLAFNFLPNSEITDILRKKFVEVLVVPKVDGSSEWCEKLIADKPRLRIIEVDLMYWEEVQQDGSAEEFQGLLGIVSQDFDRASWTPDTKISFADYFSERCGACSKSNAMVLCGDKNGISYLAGAGQGQPNRIDALDKLAIPRAKDFCERMNVEFGALTCYSDAFLPFADSIEVLAENGIKRLIQPGGSKNDDKVVARANELGVEQVLTGTRHFWH